MSTVTLHHPATRAEWLKLRHGYVSSTESAALFGMSLYTTAFELAISKQKPEPEEIESSERMAWGTRLQDAIAQGFGEIFGVLVRPQRAYATHPACRMGSSFDWEVCGLADEFREVEQSPVLRDMFAKHGPGILEIKNVDSLVYKNEWAEEPPEHIDVQVQHELEVIRYPWACIGVLVGGNRAEALIRERDETVGRVIVKKIDAFWANLAKGILPDPVMPQDAEILIAMNQYAEPGKLYDGQGDGALAKLCDEYAQAGAAEKAAADLKQAAKAGILQMIGSHEKAITTGYNVSTWMQAAAEVSFLREPFRGFRVTKRKVKNG